MTDENLSIEELYNRYAEKIIADNRVTEKTIPDLVITAGGKQYKPAEIIKEITEKTDFGTDYLRSYHAGQQFFGLDK